MNQRAAAVAMLVLLSGCSFFGRGAKNNIYTIDPIAPNTRLANVSGVAVGIDAVELPPGFDRREIVVRQANQQLDVRGTELWSASLQPVVLHTLAFDLASRLPEGMVVLPGQAKPAVMRSVDVVFEQLAPGPDRSIILDARWVLRTGATAGVAHQEHIAIDIPSFDSANVATGMGQALAALADRIAAQL